MRIFDNVMSLAQELKNCRQQGKKIVWTNGCFDLLHPGHIKTFEESKKMGDILVVGINGDSSPYRKEKPGRPINTQDFRAKMLDAIRWIDYIYIYDEETPLLAIKTLLPDILVKGGDYNIEDIVGYKEVVENGGKVLTIPIVEDNSTTIMIQKILETYK